MQSKNHLLSFDGAKVRRFSATCIKRVEKSARKQSFAYRIAKHIQQFGTHWVISGRKRRAKEVIFIDK